MTIYCDIDGTLTDDPKQAGGKLRVNILSQLKAAIAAGHEVVLWSGRGRTYVNSFADLHGIKAIACLKKPDLVVDDTAEVRPGARYRPITPEQFLTKKL